MSNFENDKYLRRYQPKTLFKKRHLPKLCENIEDHGNCQITRNGSTYIIGNSKNFVKKAMHPVNHSMCQEKPLLLSVINMC